MADVVIMGTTSSGFLLPIRIDNDNNLITASDVIPPNGQVLLGSTEANIIQADSSTKATADTQNRPGWYWSNKALGQKFNWYFYNGANHGYTISNLRLITATVSCDNVIYKPFFVVYTKPLGSGDLIPGFAHSARIYTTNGLFIEGQKCLFSVSLDGYQPTNNDNLQVVEFQFLRDDGIVANGMEIATISIQSDSANPIGTSGICVENVGFRILNETLVYNLVAPASGGSGVSDVSITSSIDLNVVNQSLTDMSFYDMGTNGKSLKVQNNTVLTTQLLTGADFTSLLIGGVSSSIDLSNSTNQSFFGNATLVSGGGSPGSGQLKIQFSIDNTNWYDTYNSFYISHPSAIFSSQYTFATKLMRFIIADHDMSAININVCYK